MYFLVEIKKYAIKTYQGYFGNEKVYGDITRIDRYNTGF